MNRKQLWKQSPQLVFRCSSDVLAPRLRQQSCLPQGNVMAHDAALPGGKCCVKMVSVRALGEPAVMKCYYVCYIALMDILTLPTQHPPSLPDTQ